MSKILLIIPAYNEEANILSVYQKIKENGQYDMIVINDGSKDSTPKILDENHIPHIDLVHNLGIGGAVQTGFKYARDNGYDIAIQFDGDGQHDVNYVKNIVQPILDGEADFVIGSRFVEALDGNFQTSAARRAGIKMISGAIKIVTGVRVKDTTSGFRAANADIIKEFSNRYPVEYPEPVSTTEILKKKYRLKEVPVMMHERMGGVSSIKAWKNAYYMVNVLLSIFVVGTRRY
ncbi:MAG: glycosyltransferase family 2 protein [Faecalicoccus sp.]|nr:glycosyltransferase family 2 protein [Faecalicoccus sp.]